MRKLETIILPEIWSSILGRLKNTNLALQKETLTMEVATKLFDSLANFRNEFDHYESIAKEKFPDASEKEREAHILLFLWTSAERPTEWQGKI